MSLAATDPSMTFAQAAIRAGKKHGSVIDTTSFRVWFAYVTDEAAFVNAYIGVLKALDPFVHIQDMLYNAY